MVKTSTCIILGALALGLGACNEGTNGNASGARPAEPRPVPVEGSAGKGPDGQPGAGPAGGRGGVGGASSGGGRGGAGGKGGDSD